jgi:tetratricopeptide (TPR) repeat protein/tRNA A-37 threonylcarbamoyl transferase component Bud32
VIGPYTLLEQIGEGGMGLVFVAEQQQPVKRRVALKIIKLGMDSRQVVGRFEAERQALAMMDHSNIAKVHDGGTTPEGRPYFVMELVRGTPLTDYCDRQRRSTRRRLELFLDVCQAVQHAHHKGIIHRDLKPSNVLVSDQEGTAVVKVIDFGIAKAIGGRLTDTAVYTAIAEMIGTPLYMSPEQAGLGDLDVDTRSDVYSLGVLLYELLTGTTPFDSVTLKKVGYDEMRRIIREDEPARPSVRLSAQPPAQLATVAELRGQEARRLHQQVRGELDWIVMKALEKDRNRRYESASAFAADVQRFLSDEPVAACPPSAWYRFGKLARRNHVALSTGALVAVILVVGTVVSAWQAVRATRAEQLAEARLRAETQAHDETEAARQDADAQRQVAEESFRSSRQAVDDFFTQVSQSTLLDVPGLQPLRKDLLEKARRYYQQMADKRGDDLAIMAGLAVAHLRLAQVYNEVNRNDDGVAALAAGVAVAERLYRQHPAAREHHRKLAGFFKGARRMEPQNDHPKDLEAAERVQTKFIDLWQKFVEENPEELSFQSDLASVYIYLGMIEGERGRGDESSVCFRKGITILERLAKQKEPDPETLAWADEYYGTYAKRLGRPVPVEWFERQRALYEGLVADFPGVPVYQEELAASLLGKARRLAVEGRHQDAEVVMQRSLDLRQQLVARLPSVEKYRITLSEAYACHAKILKDTKWPDQAEAPLRKALAVAEQSVADFPHASSCRARLGRACRDLADVLARYPQRGTEAAEFRRRDTATFRVLMTSFPEDAGWPQQLAHALCINAGAWLLLERHDLAENDFREATKVLGQAIQLDPQSIAAYDRRCRVYAQLGQWPEARQDIVRLTEISPGLVPEMDVRFLDAALLARAGDADGYRKACARALRQFEGAPYHRTAFLVARLCCLVPHWGADPDRAIQLAQRAVRAQPGVGWYHYTLGLAHYRAGHFEQAAACARESLRVHHWYAHALTRLLLAMTCQQLKETEQAGRWLREADRTWRPAMYPHDALEFQILRSEAEALVRGRNGSAPGSPKAVPR